MALKLSPERVSLVKVGWVCLEDRMLQTEGTAGEDQEQQRPLVQSRKQKVWVWSREAAEWEGKGGLAGPCKGFSGSSQEQMKATKGLKQGVFIFSLQDYCFR